MTPGALDLLQAAAWLGVPAWLAWCRWVEPTWLAVRRVPVDVRGLGGLRILHLSDFHVGPLVPLSLIERAVALGLAERPDLICLTGDFVTWRLDDEARYAAVLAPLAEAAPTFAVTGNHDGGRWAAGYGGYAEPTAVRELLERAGVRVLANARTSVAVRGRPVHLVGLGDLWSGDCRPEAAFAAPPDGEGPVIALCHNPDAVMPLLSPYRWDLALCGHSHGGQVDFPLFGTPFAPIEDKRFVRGLVSVDGRLVHVSVGVGMVVRWRFRCRPEVALLEGSSEEPVEVAKEELEGVLARARPVTI